MLSLLLFEHFNLSSLSVITFDLESHTKSYNVNYELTLYTSIKESKTP